MVIFKIQVTTEGGIKYVEYSSTSLKEIEEVLELCSKMVSKTHYLAPIPVWEKTAAEYNVEFSIKFDKTLNGLLLYMLYKLFKFTFKYVPKEKYIERFEVGAS